MNQTFNLKRFSLLFAKHTTDNYKTYLMAFFVLLGVLFLSMGFAAYVSKGQLSVRAQIPFFIFVYLLAGSIFTSIAFSDLGNKKKAIALLTLPASNFEKYLIGWIYSFIIFQLLYIPAFYLIVILIQKLGSSGERDIELMDLFSNDQRVYIVFLFFAVLHSVALWGSIFFEKLHFIKTAFCFFIGVFTLSLLNTEFMRVLIDKSIRSAAPFNRINIMDANNMYWNVMLPWKYDMYVLAILLLLVVIMWICTFYRVKEKEV